MRNIIITPIQKRDLKLALHPHMRDMEDIFMILDGSVGDFYNVTNGLHRGLDRHYRQLHRVPRGQRISRGDYIVLNNLMKSLDQACNAICMTLDHFNESAGAIAEQQKQYALVKSRQNGRDKIYNRYRHASSNYRVKATINKMDRSSPRIKKAMVKVGIPKNIFGILQNIGIMSSEKTLNRTLSRLNEVLVKIVENRDDVLNIIDDILYTLNKINSDGYPDKEDRIREVRALRSAVEKSFNIQYEHILNFKNAFEQNVSLLKQNVTNAVNEVKESTEAVTDEEAADIIRKIMETS